MSDRERIIEAACAEPPECDEDSAWDAGIDPDECDNCVGDCPYMTRPLLAALVDVYVLLCDGASSISAVLEAHGRVTALVEGHPADEDERAARPIGRDEDLPICRPCPHYEGITCSHVGVDCYTEAKRVPCLFEEYEAEGVCDVKTAKSSTGCGGCEYHADCTAVVTSALGMASPGMLAVENGSERKESCETWRARDANRVPCPFKEYDDGTGPCCADEDGEKR